VDGQKSAIYIHRRAGFFCSPTIVGKTKKGSLHIALHGYARQDFHKGRELARKAASKSGPPVLTEGIPLGRMELLGM
jgi:hypothetical protein